MNRRQFIHRLSLSVLAIPGMNAMAGVTSRDSLPVHFIYDTGVGAGRTEVEQLGVRVNTFHPISGDVTALWRDQLEDLWREQSILTAGVTHHAEYFVLKTLARDHGYVTFHESDTESESTLFRLKTHKIIIKVHVNNFSTKRQDITCLIKYIIYCLNT